jgi:hypothetical protein
MSLVVCGPSIPEATYRDKESSWDERDDAVFRFDRSVDGLFAVNPVSQDTGACESDNRTNAEADVREPNLASIKAVLRLEYKRKSRE